MRLVRRWLPSFVMVVLIVSVAWMGVALAQVQPFTDWDEVGLKAEVEFATEKGLIKGFADGSFRPDEPLTREQAAALLTRLYGAVTGEPVPSTRVGGVDVVFREGFEGTAEQRAEVFRAFESSSFPWDETFPGRRLEIILCQSCPTSGSAGGMSINTAFPIYEVAQHELGHVLDGMLLDWEAKGAITERLCGGCAWYGNDSIPWALRGAEMFAEAYQSIYHHGQLTGAAAGYELSDDDWLWLRQLLEENAAEIRAAL